MASSTRVTRCGATLGAWFTTRETVLRLTPARAATSCMVGALVEAERAGSWNNVISSLLSLEGAMAVSLAARLDKVVKRMLYSRDNVVPSAAADAGQEEGTSEGSRSFGSPAPLARGGSRHRRDRRAAGGGLQRPQLGIGVRLAERPRPGRAD